MNGIRFVIIYCSICFVIKYNQCPTLFIKSLNSRIHAKMYPSISFFGTQQKQFLLCRNRTNLQYRAHMYFLTCLFCLYVRLNTGLITIIYILDTHLFSNFVILTFDYDLCGVLVENLEFCIFCRYISVFPASTHSASQQHHSMAINFHHPHTVCIYVLYSLLLQ